MKQLFVLVLLTLALSVAGTAQRPGERFQRQRLRVSALGAERVDIQRDLLRYDRMERRAHRDGVVTPMERKKLRKKKMENRRELIRYRHNRIRKVI